MTGQNYLEATYRLPDENIRPGNSPSDELVVIRNVTANPTVVSVPFKVGTKLYFSLLTEVTVDGTDAAPTASISGGTSGKALIFGKSLNQML